MKPNGHKIMPPVDAAYHQQITNQFRVLYPYGQRPIQDPALRKILLDNVYNQYPLPPVGR